jgi:hypothetical protein
MQRVLHTSGKRKKHTEREREREGVRERDKRENLVRSLHITIGIVYVLLLLCRFATIAILR